MDSSSDQALTTYLDELYHWNERLNLTRVPRAAAWTRHIEESRQLLDIIEPAQGASIIDVGSGGGIPGIPIAVLSPGSRITLVESDTRKAAFLRHMLGLLALTNGTVLAERAETLGKDPEHREHYDIAVSRATAAPAVLCELTLPLIRVGGHLVAVVGDANSACRQAQWAALVCGGTDLMVAGPGFMHVSKARGTPPRLPRRVGVPGRRPLGSPDLAP